jgi:hypothetical protein
MPRHGLQGPLHRRFFRAINRRRGRASRLGRGAGALDRQAAGVNGGVALYLLRCHDTNCRSPGRKYTPRFFTAQDRRGATPASRDGFERETSAPCARASTTARGQALSPLKLSLRSSSSRRCVKKFLEKTSPSNLRIASEPAAGEVLFNPARLLPGAVGSAPPSVTSVTTSACQSTPFAATRFGLPSESRCRSGTPRIPGAERRRRNLPAARPRRCSSYARSRSTATGRRSSHSPTESCALKAKRTALPCASWLANPNRFQR